MPQERLAQLRDTVVRLFPERRLYLRTGGDMHTLVLSTARQIALSSVGVVAVAWTLLASFSMVAGAVTVSKHEREAVKTKAYYERLIADRQARLNSAVAELSSASGSVEALAQTIERRHAALAMLMADMKGAPGAAAVLAPIKPESLAGRSAMGQIQAVGADQERLVATAETYARTRGDRLRLAFRLAGLEPSAFSGRTGGGVGLGGPLIEAKDPRALAAVLDVDEGFAARIQHAAKDLNAAQSLGSAVQRLPLSKPVDIPVRTSTFGVRFDPFTHRPAFHAGQDFAGAWATPIHATAPGVISFTGQRTGYGNVVEIDHGGGFKTRYAHLQAISVATGQRVGIGQRIGAMGSTGRSTGVHLHYEVWENGRVQDPTRFIKAGDYVQQDNQLQ